MAAPVPVAAAATSSSSTTSALPQRRDAGPPADVGILAMEVYFPTTYVNQTELETFDKAPAGKYTIGLGQTNMAFCGDREDINSICLTVVQSLLEKYAIDPATIGRLEVGTETLVDKSKSVKTVLMRLFAGSGNTDIEGVDTTNACYGGTNALFNSVNWVESSSWDGRLALVVAADIAVYAEGNARPTGGCGAVAMLVGPDAPLVLERGTRATHMADAWDFYKPRLDSEYPVVDGKLSIECYFSAVDRCFSLYAQKFERAHGRAFDVARDFDNAVFHSPFTKLVQKSFGRLFWNDQLAHPERPDYAPLARFAAVPRDQSYTDRELEAAWIKFSAAAFEQKVVPSLLAAKELGNLYTGSVYGGIVSLLTQVPADQIEGRRILIFSYGSGLAASMFALVVKSSPAHIATRLAFAQRLAARTRISPLQFNQTLKIREEKHQACDYKPSDSIEQLAPGTFYLDHVDAQFRRQYLRRPLATSRLEETVAGSAS